MPHQSRLLLALSLLLLSSLSDVFVLADCNDTAYAAVSASIVANGLLSTYFVGTNTVVVTGNSVVLACNTTNNNHLSPDPSGTGMYNLTCEWNNTFIAPTTWPTCAKMCPVPTQLQSGYVPLPSNNYTYFAPVGGILQYTCGQPNFYPQTPGAPVNLYNLTCGAQGTFPAAVFWPWCVAMCHAPPTAPSGYNDTNNNAGKYFSPGASAAYQCSGMNQLVNGTTSNTYHLTCLSNGSFPSTAWPACAVACIAPQPASGFVAQNASTTITNVTTVAVQQTLAYVCRTPNATYDSSLDTVLTLTCQSTGIFLPATWGTCAVRCPLPVLNASLGFAPYPNNTVPVIAGQSLTLTCLVAGQTVGVTLKSQYMAQCGANGAFQTSYPSCAMMCAVPNGEPGYGNQPATTGPAVPVGTVLTYACAAPGQTVGTTLSSNHSITCMSNGSFPGSWPTCAVMCPVPVAPMGYLNQTNTTPVAVGVTLGFSCAAAGALVGSTSSSVYTSTCLSSGQFDTNWPNCSVRCAPPLGQPGYNAQPAGTPTVPVAGVFSYTCTDPTALVGTTASDTFNATCDPMGQLVPATWPNCTTRCLVPNAVQESGYAAYSGNLSSVAVGASLTFACQMPNATVGSTGMMTHTVTCGVDGTFPMSWPSCAVLATCPTPPDPSSANTSLTLAPGTPSVITSYMSVTYVCNTTGQVTDLGASISLMCLVTGAYQNLGVPWPVCRAPVACTASIPIPPAYTGLANSTSTSVKTEDQMATYSCANSTFLTASGSGTFNLTCGSDGTFGTTINWAVCTDPNPPPPPPPCMCLGSISSPATAKTLRDTLCRNASDGSDYQSPVGVSPPMSAPYRMRCGTTDLAAISQQTLCYCDSPLEEARTSFSYSLLLAVMPWEWTEDDDGDSFLQDVTSAGYISLKAQVEQSLDDTLSASALGAASSYVRTAVTCFHSGPPVPLGMFPSVQPTPAPAAAPAAPAVTTTTTTTASTAAVGKRKKRQFSGYTYVQVNVTTQFLAAGIPTQASFQALLASLGVASNGTVGTIVIDPTCAMTTNCHIQNPSTCSNSYFYTLPPGYSALTPIGYYVPPYNASLVDAGNLLQVGEVAQLSCTNPDQYPRNDSQDTDPNDHALTVYCTPPTMAGGMGSWSLTTIPDCATVCPALPFPVAPNNTDLLLTSVRPYGQTTLYLNLTSFNTSAAFILAGDALIYTCQTPLWGLNGGPDTVYDGFTCTDSGMVNVPMAPTAAAAASASVAGASAGATMGAGTGGAPAAWPTCSPQLDMVIDGVVESLDNADQMLENTFKLIGYRQSDFESQIVNSKDLFTNVTIPVMCALILLIAIFCCCARDGSPACKLCRSKLI